MKKIALFALVSGSGLLALQEPVENESVAARPQQELPPGAQRHQPLQAESHTISANPGAGEVTTYEGPLEAGYEVETSSGHGVTVPKHSIGLFRGNYKPEPGISSSILNLAASEGKAFAFLMFEEGWEQAQVAQAELQRAGVIFRGELPGQAFQVEIPSKALAALQSTLGVRWVGELPLEHKIHPALLEEMEALAPGKSLRAYVGLMGDDWKDGNEVIVARRIAYTESGPDSGEGRPIFMPNGPFQAYLEGLGLEVTRYARNTRSFAVEGPARVILELARRNDVHFLDSNSRATGSHDESVAFVGQDYIRDTFDGFSTEVGIIDSEIMMYDSQGGDHDDLDIFCVGWDNTGLGVGQNAHGHGTHVAGTVLGRGIADNRMEGNAKGVGSSGTQRLFHGRYLDASNSGVGDPADLYDDLSDSYTDGSGNTTFRPKVINNSWGANGSWNGTEQRCIDVDEVVWDHQQTYVFAAGNDGSGSGRVGRPAVAKNVLTVANAETFESGEGNNDAGDLRDSSSRGPTGDNRLKPEITAPGCWINSTDAFDFSGYVEFNGTSMAAPHVTGVLASFIDSYGSLVQYNPKLNRAWTAATALKKSGDRFADSEFGFGYMNSYRMQYSTSDWALSYLDNSTVNTSTTWVSTLITVPANCERLGIYLNWDEPPCSITAGSTPILADVELYLDYDDNQSGGNTGNVVADGNGNYQYMIINNPPEGTHKIKIWPVDTTISGLFADDLDVALTIMREYDDVRPEISLTSDFQDDTVQPGQTVTLESTASNSDYIATNVMYNLLSNPS
ncbi:MAG: S8 family serine peptidase, partial [Planctomycetes bacterium]|nr:S8 family serine peptidase [Planctomycetota bacterium]